MPLTVIELRPYRAAYDLDPLSRPVEGVQDRLGHPMVPAFYSSALIRDGKPVTMRDPAGFVIQADGRSI